MMPTICRSPAPSEPPLSHRLEGQVGAVGLLAQLAACSTNADAPDLFTAAVGQVIALAVAGDIDAAEEHLAGMARILGPAIRDGVIARRSEP